MESGGSDSARPVPTPRRTVVAIHGNISEDKLKYENVTIDLINKNIDVSSENLQHNLCKPKVMNDKSLSLATLQNNNKPIDNADEIGAQSTSVHPIKLCNQNNLIDDDGQVRPVPAPRRTHTALTMKTDSPPGTGAIRKTTNNVVEPSKSNQSATDCGSAATLHSASSESSISESSERFSTASPSALLKSLGATSKLLTEAISERIASKSKGAKHKLEKNLRNSKHLLTHTASSTLHSVRKKMNNISPVSTSNLDQQQRIDARSMTDPTCADRPQTLPSNDHVFKSIVFNSPLQIKTANISDLPSAHEFYDVPASESTKYKYSSYDLPSYDDCVQQEPAFLHRKSLVTRSMYKSKDDRSTDERAESTERGDQTAALVRGNSDTNLYVKMECNRSSNASQRESLPCPNYPPPILQSQPTDSVYGALATAANQIHQQVVVNADTTDATTVAPKLRPESGSQYENVEIRQKCSAARPTKQMVPDTESKIFSRSIFSGHSAGKDLKSESWNFYDSTMPETKVTSVAEESEPVYGKLCEMATDLLQPHTLHPIVKPPRKKNIGQRSTMSNIIKEFDPLSKLSPSHRATTAQESSKKPNELILLENLLSNETYGQLNNVNDTDLAAGGLSEEEDLATDCNYGFDQKLPTPPERFDSLQLSLLDINNVHIPSDKQTAASSQTTDECKNSNSKLNKSPELSTVKTVENDETFVDPPSYNEALGLSLNNEKPPKEMAIDKTASVNDLEKPPNKLSSMLSSVLGGINLKRKPSIKVAAESATSNVKVAIAMIPKPNVLNKFVHFEGHLIRLPTKKAEDILKELHSRKVTIRDNQFKTYQDAQEKVPKETFPLDYITTIQCVLNHKFTSIFLLSSHSTTDLHCFEITTAIPKNRNATFTNANLVVTSSNMPANKDTERVCHLYASCKRADRNLWMQKIIESMTDVFPGKYTSEFTRAGWCYLKNSITSQWAGAWILLYKRKLFFYSTETMNLEKLDLRKARCVVLKECDESIGNLHVATGPTLLVDCPPFTIYFIMSSSRETKIWRHIISEAAHNNGPVLKQQQLTKDNIPVFVDKCINFVYTHGSMSEGIYRKSGSEQAIHKLLNSFRGDAFSLQILRTEYTEHDVANALKRYMRDLPEKLLGRYLMGFISVATLPSKSVKIDAFKELLQRLPTIEYETLKKLIGHLHFIQSQKARNKMTIENLALLWGPTLLHDNHSDMGQYPNQEADAMIDLIMLYKNIFTLSAEEINREMVMLTVLQKYHAASESLADTAKQSGDLKVWITLNPDGTAKSSSELEQVNVTLTPLKTANDICKEVCGRLSKASHEISLIEVILDESLVRPLHHSERVLDIVLRWTYWCEADRKNNYLSIGPHRLLPQIERALKNMTTVTPNAEMRYADEKTKNLKTYSLELYENNVNVIRRDRNGIECATKEIDLNEVIAYLGSEGKREPALRWAITLIKRSFNKRTREAPFIGHVLNGANANEQMIWYSSIFYSLHKNNIYPEPEKLFDS